MGTPAVMGEMQPGLLHSIELAGARNRQEPRPLPSGLGRSPMLQAQLQPPSHGSGCRHPGTFGDPGSPGPCRLGSAYSHSLASLCSQHPLQCKVIAKPGCCHDPARCAHTRSSAEMPALPSPTDASALSGLWAPMNAGGKPGD